MSPAKQILAVDKQKGKPEPITPRREKSKVSWQPDSRNLMMAERYGSSGIGNEAKELLAKTLEWIEEYTK
jgi:hypothetical protein